MRTRFRSPPARWGARGVRPPGSIPPMTGGGRTRSRTVESQAADPCGGEGAFHPWTLVYRRRGHHSRATPLPDGCRSPWSSSTRPDSCRTGPPGPDGSSASPGRTPSAARPVNSFRSPGRCGRTESPGRTVRTPGSATHSTIRSAGASPTRRRGGPVSTSRGAAGSTFCGGPTRWSAPAPNGSSSWPRTPGSCATPRRTAAGTARRSPPASRSTQTSPAIRAW